MLGRRKKKFQFVLQLMQMKKEKETGRRVKKERSSRDNVVK